MLKRGADINSTDDNLITPLHYAASSLTDTAVIDLLIRYRASVNTKINDGKTPLYLTALARTTETAVIELLISYRASVNAKINHGKTPLYLTALARTTETIVIKLLISHRALVNILANNWLDGYTTLLGVIASLGNIAICRYLVNYNANIELGDL